MAVTYERKRSLRKIGPVIDKINIVLSAIIIVCAVFIVINIHAYMVMFPVVFTLSAVMNGLMAFKCFKMAEMGRFVVLCAVAVLMTALSVIGYIVTL